MIGIIKPSRMALTPAEYVKERDKALMDIEDFVHFAAKYLQDRPLPKFNIIEISFHQLRTACNNIPREEKLKSWKWLRERNYQTWDDGELENAVRTDNPKPN